MNHPNSRLKHLGIALLLLAFGGICAAATWAVKPSAEGGIAARVAKPDEIFPGCVLVTPFPQLLAHNFEAKVKPRAFLVNKKTGNTVREWSAPYPIFTAKIDAAGNLWAFTNKMWDGDSPAEVIRLNDRSEQTARVFAPNLVEDFDFGPEGKSIFLLQQYEKKNSAAGIPPKYERILEVEIETQKVMWEWDLQQVGASESQLNPQQRSNRGITHANSVRFVPTNPINQKPAVLVSARNLSKVFLIDYESRKLIWESADGLMEFQHDARLLDNGDLLIFNNRRLSAFSSVDQIDLKRNETIWQYRSATEQEFHSAILGGAQRLPNGNTLITHGMRGHVFEINPRKEVVWEYFQNQEILPPTAGWPLAPLFRVENYSSEFIGRLGWGTICQ